MEELSEFFGGARSLGKVQPDENFQVWFTEMKTQIGNLTFTDSTYAGRKI